MPAGSIHYAAAAPRISRNAFSFLLLREGKERRRSLARSSKEEEHERNGTERNGTERNGGKVNFHPFFHLPRFPRGTRLQTTELIIAFKLLPPNSFVRIGFPPVSSGTTE